MNKNDIVLEKPFEEYVTLKMQDLHNWRYSENDKDFDPETAFCWPDFVSWLKATAPQKIAKAQQMNGDGWENIVKKSLRRAIDNYGTIRVLRDGFGVTGLGTIVCCGHKPKDDRDEVMNTYYRENILRVMRQVHYQTLGNKSLDTVFFINGIPVATAEIKTEFTQNVNKAVDEYRNERQPVEPKTKRQNTILMYKKGAVVHFAISESEIWMCTKLDGEKSHFLPFNKGNGEHAGNPPMKKGDKDYPTSYFWNEICQRDNWIDIFQGFVFEEVKTVEDVDGHLREKVTQIFPRYHQWDCVTRVLRDISSRIDAGRYLIEHSAGSGKTATISWLAFKLSDLRTPEGTKYFDSVIIVTDSTVLDANVKDTLRQLKMPANAIAMIGGDGHIRKGGSKSSQLSEALDNRTPIIVVTIQTFPYALKMIAESEGLANARFAILADEAHRSQTGKDAGMMKSILSNIKKMRKTGDDSDIDDEDVINEMLKDAQNKRAMPANITFLAFTATPKHSTFELFGTPTGEIDEKTGRELRASFHRYTMRQAIEEGYILDVLEGYMPYETAYRIGYPKDDETLVDSRQAKKSIARWKTIHPVNVTQKVEFIIEHFAKNVSHLLNGEAKAMIVTSSRAMVVRYHAAFKHYLDKHPEYKGSNIQGKLDYMIIGEPLAAFSGSVKGSQAIAKEDSTLEDNPFTVIDADLDYDEKLLNPNDVNDIAKAFDRRQYRFLIVANKFQTGFDQKKLCAMYVDKSIANEIEIVQTYSRLNRTFPGKEKVFIIDFINDKDQVLKAFQTYDKGAHITEAQDLNIVYDIKAKLDDSGFYDEDDLDTFRHIYFSTRDSIYDRADDKNEDRIKLFAAVDGPARKWNDEMTKLQRSASVWRDTIQESRNAGDAKTEERARTSYDKIQEEISMLLDFKKLLGRFCTSYSYISQIVQFDDPDVENFAAFAELLKHRLSGTIVDDIDVTGIVLQDYRINRLAPPVSENDETPALSTVGSGGKSSVSKLATIKEILEQLNQIFNEDIPVGIRIRTVNAIADSVASDTQARQMVANETNSKSAIVSNDRFLKLLVKSLLQIRDNELGPVAGQIINDSEATAPLASLIYDLLRDRTRIDMSILDELEELNE